MTRRPPCATPRRGIIFYYAIKYEVLASSAFPFIALTIAIRRVTPDAKSRGYANSTFGFRRFRPSFLAFYRSALRRDSNRPKIDVESTRGFVSNFSVRDRNKDVTILSTTECF